MDLSRLEIRNGLVGTAISVYALCYSMHKEASGEAWLTQATVDFIVWYQYGIIVDFRPPSNTLLRIRNDVHQDGVLLTQYCNSFIDKCIYWPYKAGQTSFPESSEYIRAIINNWVIEYELLEFSSYKLVVFPFFCAGHYAACCLVRPDLLCQAFEEDRHPKTFVVIMDSLGKFFDVPRLGKAIIKAFYCGQIAAAVPTESSSLCSNTRRSKRKQPQGKLLTSEQEKFLDKLLERTRIILCEASNNLFTTSIDSV